MRDAAAAFTEARSRAERAHRDLIHHRQVELPAARAKDTEQAANAIERNKPTPEPKFERKADTELGNLERAAEATNLVRERAQARLDERIAGAAEEIAGAADERLAKIKGAYSTALDDLAAAVTDLIEAQGLAEWAGDPTSNYRTRGGPRAKVMVHSDEPVPVVELIDAMRTALEPPGRRPLPSPFSVPVMPEPAPAPVPDHAVEVAAGMHAAQED